MSNLALQHYLLVFQMDTIGSWLKKYSWLRYSPTLDAVFCGPCSVLISSANREGKGLLVNRPFFQWVKVSDTLTSHSKAAYHSDCLQAADVLKATIENPNARLDVIQSTALELKIDENKHILFQIVHAALFLGKQGLALRGDTENTFSAKNPVKSFCRKWFNFAGSSSQTQSKKCYLHLTTDPK